MAEHAILPPADDLLARPALADLEQTDPADDMHFARRSARYLLDVGVTRRQIRTALERELGLTRTQAARAVSDLPVAA